ncbi:helix-turn-helix domain-containing protein [Candidatus Manganitrophus noduliformans]|uniref:helix-turn-helix domain-containing protein n=1 Tax=Candidatus Manganitrophus noduliformans TaxID=2606439 RepID=UPI001439C2A0|nr:helix-turn-helix transcriptional regulator [Candidatus Manganitrophus noduliformans]
MQIIQGLTERLKLLIAEKFKGKPGRLARLAGISPGTFQRYIDGSSIPGGETLFKIHEASGVSIDWLLLGKEVTPEAIDTEVKEIADLVSEKGRREEWLSYGRYLATGEKQITLSPNFLMLLEKVPPNQRPEVISGWIEQAKRAEEALRLRGFGQPQPTPQKSNQPKKDNEKKAR